MSPLLNDNLLIDRLAQVFHDADEAKELARRARFPTEHLPKFETSSIFWANVIEKIRNGMVPDGMKALLHEASKAYPDNETFSDFLKSTDDSRGGSSGAERGGEDAPADRTRVELASQLGCHVDEIEAWISSHAFHSRSLVLPDARRVVVNSQNPGPLLDADASYFISGWSGRGKSTMLRMLAHAALSRTASVIPIRLGPRVLEGSLLEQVQQVLRVNVPALDDPRMLAAWMQEQQTLIIIDDWHRIPKARREAIEGGAAQVGSWPIRFLIAGVETLRPRIEGLHDVEVRAYLESERDEIIKARLGPTWDHTVRQAHPRLLRILCEPMFLETFLRAVTVTAQGVPRLPNDLPSVMHQYLTTALDSRVDRPIERADELCALGQQLARGGGPIALFDVSRALDECRVEGNASDTASLLCDLGVLVRGTGAAYEFSHDLWRTYFRASRRVLAEDFRTPDGIRCWVEGSNEVELRSYVPFMSAMLQEYELQEALYDALLRRDLAVYLEALTTRADTRRPEGDVHREAQATLEQIYRGYFDLVSVYFAPLKPWLEPWRQGDGEEEARQQKAVVVGMAREAEIAYYLGFGAQTGSDVIVAGRDALLVERPHYAPVYGVSVRSAALALSGKRMDSGRLGGAEVLFGQLKKIVAEDCLPAVAWIARERLLERLVSLAIAAGWSSGWRNRWTVRDVARWIDQQYDEYREGAYGTPLPFVGDGAEVDLDEVHQLVGVLVEDGLEDYTIKSLRLPASGGADEERVDRVVAIYTAVAQTYRRLCERFFPVVKNGFLYAQFPCRAVVGLKDDVHDLRWLMYWEVVEDWDMAPRVEIVEDGFRSFDFHEIVSQTKAACERLDRRFIALNWVKRGDRGRSIVTKIVSGMLNSDIERFSRLISGAH